MRCFNCFWNVGGYFLETAERKNRITNFLRKIVFINYKYKILKNNIKLACLLVGFFIKDCIAFNLVELLVYFLFTRTYKGKSMGTVTRLTENLKQLQLRPFVVPSGEVPKKSIVEFFTRLQQIQMEQGLHPLSKNIDPVSKKIISWNTKVLEWYGRYPQITTVNISQVQLALDELTNEILSEFLMNAPLEVIINQRGEVLYEPMVDYAPEVVGESPKWHVWDGFTWSQYKRIYDNAPINPFTHAPNFETTVKVHALARDMLMLIAELPVEVYDYPLKRVEVSEDAGAIVEIDPTLIMLQKLKMKIMFSQLIDGFLLQQKVGSVVKECEEQTRQIQARTTQFQKELVQAKVQSDQAIREHGLQLEQNLTTLAQQRRTEVEALKRTMGLQVQTAQVQVQVQEGTVAQLRVEMSKLQANVSELNRANASLRAHAQHLQNELNDNDDSSCSIM